MKDITYQIKDDFSSLKSDYKYSYFEAFLTSFTVGIAENFFAAFSIDQNMTTLQSGLLLSLPLIVAVFFNIVGHIKFKNQKLSKQIQRNVLLQVGSLLGLCLMPLLSISSPEITFVILLCLYSVYWFGHFSSQPSWIKWISEFIDHKKGAEYFELRTRMTQLGILTGLILGGFLLNSNQLQIRHSYLFTSLFTLGILAQFLKLYSLKKHVQSESVLSFSILRMKTILKKNNNFFSSYALFNLSLFLSAPFVTGYLLAERHISYFQFMTVTASLIIGKITTTYILSLYENQTQPIKMMALGGLIAAPLPALWPYCQSIESMYGLNFISGMSWALWEIGISLSFFKNVQTEEKIETVSLYNVIGIVTQVSGTIIGALLIKYFWNSNYNYAFMAAGIIRFICILPLQKTKGLGHRLNPTLEASSMKDAS